jgi:hypothetical protein
VALKSELLLRGRSMAAGETQVSSKITLIGIALIWMTAQVSVLVAQVFWIDSGAYRNAPGEWCCGNDNCDLPGQTTISGKGWPRRQDDVRLVRR